MLAISLIEKIYLRKKAKIKQSKQLQQTNEKQFRISWTS